MRRFDLIWALTFFVLYLFRGSTLLPLLACVALVGVSFVLLERNRAHARLSWRVAGPLLFLVGWRALSVVLAPTAAGLLDVVVLALGMILFAVAAGSGAPGRVWWARMAGITLAAAPVGLLGAWETFHPETTPWGRAASTLGNPNLLGAVAAPLALLSACIAVRAASARVRLGYAVIGGLLLLSLWGAQSRGALLGLLAGAGFLALTRARLGMSFPLRLGASAGLLVCLATVAAWSIYRDGVTDGPRWVIWSAAAGMVAADPWTGVGVGQFEAAFHAGWGRPSLPVPHAHSVLLQYGAETGVPGLLALMAMLAGVTAGAWRAYGRADREGRAALAMAAAVFTALLTQNLVDYVLWCPATSALFWGFCGLLAGAGSADTPPVSEFSDVPAPAGGRGRPG